MDYEPRLTFLTCVWLAMKVEEFNTKIDDFCYNLYTTKQDAIKAGQHLTDMGDEILAFELSLMKALNYDLIIHSPFRALEGLKMDIEIFKNNFISSSPDNQILAEVQIKNNKAMRPESPMNNNTNDLLGHLFIKANQWLVRTFSTNSLHFLYPPSQLALASLAHTSKNLRKTHPFIFKCFGEYMNDNIPFTAQKKQKLMGIIKFMGKALKTAEEFPEIKMDQVNSIKMKLEKIRNPIYNPRRKEFRQSADEDNMVQMSVENNQNANNFYADPLEKLHSQLQDFTLPEHENKENRQFTDLQGNVLPGQTNSNFDDHSNNQKIRQNLQKNAVKRLAEGELNSIVNGESTPIVPPKVPARNRNFNFSSNSIKSKLIFERDAESNLLQDFHCTAFVFVSYFKILLTDF